MLTHISAASVAASGGAAAARAREAIALSVAETVSGAGLGADVEASSVYVTNITDLTTGEWLYPGAGVSVAGVSSSVAACRELLGGSGGGSSVGSGRALEAGTTLLGNSSNVLLVSIAVRLSSPALAASVVAGIAAQPAAFEGALAVSLHATAPDIFSSATHVLIGTAAVKGITVYAAAISSGPRSPVAPAGAGPSALPAGAIAGIAVGVAAALVVGILAAFAYQRAHAGSRRRSTPVVMDRRTSAGAAPQRLSQQPKSLPQAQQLPQPQPPPPQQQALPLAQPPPLPPPQNGPAHASVTELDVEEDVVNPGVLAASLRSTQIAPAPHGASGGGLALRTLDETPASFV